jgi:CubicO group peptidase (beta-lactamase class C family)
MHRAWVPFLALLAACSGRPAPTAALSPTPGERRAAPPLAGGAQLDATGKPELVASDSARVTAGGVSYIVPAGWTSLVNGAVTVLTAQEGDSRVALIETRAQEPDAAVAEAWALYRKAPPPPLKLATDLPGREGWEQMRGYAYQLPPNEKRGLGVSAQRHGQAWLVVLWDGSDATFAKRAAQFGLIGDSLRPASYERESFAGKSANALDAARLAKLDELIELGRKELDVPGVALAVLQRGKLVHARGYGVRELGKPAKVDENSLFLIASNTKALTTLLLAQLVDAGKLRWDEPVSEAYPDFKLGDAATTGATHIEHLVCACTGLPRKDFEWLFEFAQATPLSELSALARIQPTTRFGETFQYSNLLAAAGGFVAAHVVAPGLELGKSYDAAMQARVFTPLGMRSTTFDFARALRGNHASAHGLDIDAKPHGFPMALNYAIVPLRPAGGAWSSASDLIRYVQLELARGVAPGQKRIVSEQNLLKRREPYAKIGEFGAYGMGLGIDESHGLLTIDHGGSLFGFKSQMFWFPEHDVGAVILTNSDEGGRLIGPFRRYLIELLFDAKPEAIEDLHTSARTLRELLAKQRARLVVPPDPAAVKALAAHYEHPELGAIDVKAGGAGTRFDFGEWHSDVSSRKNDDGTLSFVTITPGTIGFDFVVGSAGEKRTLILREAQHEYVFMEGG